eukprot:Amastigsp_a6997_24.p5 type:complete len:107 gc:universal Amastigsp_a6997_24:1090-770(-)
MVQAALLPVCQLNSASVARWAGLGQLAARVAGRDRWHAEAEESADREGARDRAVEDGLQKVCDDDAAHRQRRNGRGGVGELSGETRTDDSSQFTVTARSLRVCVAA